MGTKREYAISLGLAQPGRGKLSKLAHEAIDKAIQQGMVFGDSSTPVVERQEIKSSPVTHKYNTVWGVCTRGRSNLPIAFQYCAKCFRQVTYCLHDIPQLPHWVGGGDAFLEYPAQDVI